MAAWGEGERSYTVNVSLWPLRALRPHLADFLDHPVRPLSIRAAQGFLSRTDRSSLRFPDGFLDAVRLHLKAMQRRPAA